MATANQIDQQRRVILAAKASAEALLSVLATLDADEATYNRLGLADNQILVEESFEGTGTDRDAYRDAIVAIGNIKAVINAGSGTNLEKFAR